MIKRSTYKEITVQDGDTALTIRIKQFTPEVGCYWAFRLLGSFGMTSFGLADLRKVIHDFINMNRKDFFELMKDCLHGATVQMGEEFHPFYSDERGYAIANIEPTAVFEIVVEAMVYSLTPFFVKKLAGKLEALVLGSFAKTGEENS